MKTDELRKKSIAELNEELVALLREQFNLRMQKGLSESGRSHNFQRVRRAIARVKTILHEKAKAS